MQGEGQTIIQRTNRKILENQNITKIQIFNMNNKSYQVYPSVFSPNIFLGTSWLTQEVVQYINTKNQPERIVQTFMEIGTGCGCILCEVIGRTSTKKVLGTDINPEAVKNTQDNLQLFQLKAEVILSDVLDGVPEQQKYDVIFWNYPFHPTEKDYLKLGPIEKSVRDPQYRGLRKLLKSSLNYLSLKGVILIGFSSTMGDQSLLKAVVSEYQMNYRSVSEMNQNGSMCLIEIIK